jgi:hypothetical protein
MNIGIGNRLKKLETQNGNNLSEYCRCGHKNTVKTQCVESDQQKGIIKSIILPCEKCGKEVKSDIPEHLTFVLNHGGITPIKGK